MAQLGDDCYFFYYSSCSKGSLCPFRHSEAALGNETVCTQWRAGSCTRPFCKFRHMEIDKNRAAIPCYWENQPGGCRKPHCVFMHYKPRSGGLQVADDSGMNTPPKEESSQRDIITSLPSIERKVEPVVVTFEEESDQESTTGSPVKRGNVVQKSLTPIKAIGPKIISTKKSTEPTEDIQVGVKSLEELKEERLLAEAKKQLADATKLASQQILLTDELQEEEEEIQEPSRRIVISSQAGAPAVNQQKEDKRIPVKSRLNIAPSKESTPPRKLPIKARLGGGRALTSIKRRLGIKAENELSQDSDSSEDTDRREYTDVKILDQQRKEKFPIPGLRGGRALTSIKSRIGIKAESELIHDSDSSEDTDRHEYTDVKTLELRKEKFAVPENEAYDDSLSRIKIKSLAQIRKEKMQQQDEPVNSVNDETQDDLSKIKVKSLAEIKREKLLARLGSGESQENAGSPTKVKVPAQMRRMKMTVQTNNQLDSENVTDEEDTLSKIKVKSLVEIKKEKQKRQHKDDEDDADLAKIQIKSLDEIKTEKQQERHKNGQEKPVGRRITSGKKSSDENVSSKKDLVNFTVRAFGSFARKSKIAPKKSEEEKIENEPEETKESEESLEELKKKVLCKQEKPKEKTSPTDRVTRKKAKREIQIYRPPRSKRTEDVKVEAPLPKVQKKRELKTEEKTKEEEPSVPKIKKVTKDWGVKTFSQIMAEKRAVQQDRRKAQQEAADTSSRSPVKTADANSGSPVKRNSIWSNRAGAEEVSKPSVHSVTKPGIKSIVFHDEATGSGVVSTSCDQGPKEVQIKPSATREAAEVVSASTSGAATQPKQPTVKRKGAEADSTGSLVKRKRTGSSEGVRARRPSLRRSSEASTGSIKAEADSTKEGRTHKDSLDDEFGEFSDGGEILQHDDDDALMQELEDFLS